eukprot:242996_1
MPSNMPSNTPTPAPTNIPSKAPTPAPTLNPTSTPTNIPTNSPTENPTNSPTFSPTDVPSYTPSVSPSESPTIYTIIPTNTPTFSPEKHLIIGGYPTQSNNIIDTTIQLTKNSNDNDELHTNNSSNNTTIVIVIICAVIAAISCMIGGGVWLWSINKEKRGKCPSTTKVAIASNSVIDFRPHKKLNSISHVDTNANTVEMTNAEGDGLINDCNGYDNNGSSNQAIIHETDDIVYINGNNTNDIRKKKFTDDKNELEKRLEDDEKADELLIDANYVTPRPPPRKNRERPASVYNENEDEKAEELSDSDEDVLFTGVKTPMGYVD